MSNLIGLQVHTRRLDARMAIVDFQGELDISTSPKAKEAMLSLLADGCSRLIVNLRLTEFIDSTGLGALVSVMRHAREQEGGVRLVGLSGRVRRLFEITRLTYAFPIDLTEEEAVKHMQEETVKS